MIWESFLGITFDSDVRKKNLNTPQFARLKRRSKTRTEEAKVETKSSKTLQQMQILRRKKLPLVQSKVQELHYTRVQLSASECSVKSSNPGSTCDAWLMTDQ